MRRSEGVQKKVQEKVGFGLTEGGGRSLWFSHHRHAAQAVRERASASERVPTHTQDQAARSCGVDSAALPADYSMHASVKKAMPLSRSTSYLYPQTL